MKKRQYWPREERSGGVVVVAKTPHALLLFMRRGMS